MIQTPIPPPNRLPWPPILYISAALIGVLLQSISPLPWFPQSWKILVETSGLVLGAAAIALEITTALTFRKAKTTIMPNRTATSLITSGPFRFTRNPIYLANTMLVSGAGLYFANPWLVIAAFIAAALTHHLAILREERHLALAFGEVWKDYAEKVPRWVGTKIGNA